MRIRWENMFGLMFFIFCIYLFFKVKPYLDRIFEDMANGYYYHSYDPAFKIIMFGLICVTIVSVVKIISKH